MFELDIPGFGPVRLSHVVCDFTGTLSVQGQLVDGVADRIRRIAEQLTFHVLTADTFGTAGQALEGLPIEFHRLSGPGEDHQKLDYVTKLGSESVIALGNGNNDRAMLRAVRVGVAVIEAEGASVQAVQAADLVVTSSIAALDLLLEPRRMRAGLRF